MAYDKGGSPLADCRQRKIRIGSCFVNSVLDIGASPQTRIRRESGGCAAEHLHARVVNIRIR